MGVTYISTKLSPDLQGFLNRTQAFIQSVRIIACFNGSRHWSISRIKDTMIEDGQVVVVGVMDDGYVVGGRWCRSSRNNVCCRNFAALYQKTIWINKKNKKWGGGIRGAVVARWTQQGDRSCDWGMMQHKIHLIRPGCLRFSLTLQCRIMA